MHNIYLVCTAHKIIGKCTPDEFYKIIQKINPDVIFEEISFSRINDFYRNKYVKTLETIVLVEYFKKYKCEHIPVETLNIPDSYIENEDYLNEIFSKTNNEIYNEYKTIFFNGINENGFMFLNSDESSDIQEKMKKCKENYFIGLNNESVNNIYKSWLTIENNRENEMLKNIYYYSKKNNYGSALFITGARHRAPFKNKIIEYEKKFNIKLNWKFNIHE